MYSFASFVKVLNFRRFRGVGPSLFVVDVAPLGTDPSVLRKDVLQMAFAEAYKRMHCRHLYAAGCIEDDDISAGERAYRHVLTFMHSCLYVKSV